MRRNAYYRLFGMELRRTAGDRLTWVGAFGFAVILGVGAWLYWRTLPPRPSNGRLFGEAFLFAAMIAWHCGFARDRASQFDSYLTANFVDPASLYFAKVSAAIVFVAAFSVFAFLLGSAASAGDFQYAARFAAVFLIAAVVSLPAIVATELALNTRHPVPVLVILFFTGLALYSRFGDARLLLARLGFDGNIAFLPTVLRVAIALGLTAAIYPLFKLRLGGRRLAALLNSS